MAQDSAPNATPSTSVSAADLANASAQVEMLSAVRRALSSGSGSFVTAITAVATAVTQKLIGGVVGTTTNRLLKSKTVSSGSSAGSLQASGITCDASDNLSGIGTLSCATLNPTNPLAINKGGTANITAVAAFDALAPTTTQGDIITRGASSNGRLALGTTGQAIVSNGTNAVWGTPSLLTSGTITNVATLDIPLGAYTGYRGITVKLYGMVPASDNVNFICRFSTDNGSTWIATGYNWTQVYTTDASTSSVVGNGSDTAIGISNIAGGTAGVGNGANEGINTSVEVLGWQLSTLWPRIMFQTYYMDATATPSARQGTGGGANETAQDLTGLQFFFASGNIATGNYAVYGLG